MFCWQLYCTLGFVCTPVTVLLACYKQINEQFLWHLVATPPLGLKLLEILLEYFLIYAESSMIVVTVVQCIFSRFQMLFTAHVMKAK